MVREPCPFISNWHDLSPEMQAVIEEVAARVYNRAFEKKEVGFILRLL